MHPGDKTTNYPSLSEVERWLIGFCINRGSSVPKITASKRSDGLTYKKTVCENLHKIKHWKIYQTSYNMAPNQAATWFIDPPYQKVGKYYYGFSTMNFNELAGWCKERQGQVIVCESEGADWLPFRPLKRNRGSMRSQMEVVYTQEIF